MSTEENRLYLQNSAEQGNAEAQYLLGLWYYSGQGGQVDYAKAAEWFSKSAEQGDAQAQYMLSISYGTGRGVPEDVTKADEWLRKSAAQGHAEAKDFLAKREAAEKRKKAEEEDKYAKKNDDMMLFAAGIVNALKNGNYAEAVKWARLGAEQGDSSCQCNLGEWYLIGRGVPQDYAKAAEWFEKAAGQGDIKAKYELGRLYFTGQGVPQDYEKAVVLLKYAARYNKDAKDFLPKAEAAREEQKAKEGFERLLKAAEQGDVDAQFNLGYSYFTGQGVTRDYTKAAEWLGKAAEQGRVGAKDFLVKVEAALEEEKAYKARKKAKEKFHTIGRGVALLLMIFAIIMMFISIESGEIGSFFLMCILFIIPFLVVFLCKGLVKKSISLGVSVFLFIVFLLLNVDSSFIIVSCISYMTSCITAMFFPKAT